MTQTTGEIDPNSNQAPEIEFVPHRWQISPQPSQPETSHWPSVFFFPNPGTTHLTTNSIEVARLKIIQDAAHFRT